MVKRKVKMKIVLLVEGDYGECEDLVNLLKRNNKVAYIDTEHQSELPERDYLENIITLFANSWDNSDIMIVRYSGGDMISKYLGDISSEMIIPVSYNVSSEYYIDNPKSVFMNFMNSFKETD